MTDISVLTKKEAFFAYSKSAKIEEPEKEAKKQLKC
jgi:hypothetical protein